MDGRKSLSISGRWSEIWERWEPFGLHFWIFRGRCFRADGGLRACKTRLHGTINTWKNFGTKRSGGLFYKNSAAWLFSQRAVFPRGQKNGKNSREAAHFGATPLFGHEPWHNSSPYMSASLPKVWRLGLHKRPKSYIRCPPHRQPCLNYVTRWLNKL